MLKMNVNCSKTGIQVATQTMAAERLAESSRPKCPRDSCHSCVLNQALRFSPVNPGPVSYSYILTKLQSQSRMLS